MDTMDKLEALREAESLMDSNPCRSAFSYPPAGSIHTHTDYANPDKPEELQQFIHVGNGKLERIETVNKRLKL